MRSTLSEYILLMTKTHTLSFTITIYHANTILQEQNNKPPEGGFARPYAVSRKFNIV